MNLADRSWSVLLVDDHPLMRDGLRAALRRVLPRAQIEEASTAAEAMERIAVCLPHLILLDVGLPGTNGLDLARRIHTAAPRIKLLMVSADADPWTVQEALSAGASGFVAKTHSTASLSQAVLAVLGGSEFLCDESRAALDRPGQDRQPAPGPSVLSNREREVLRYLAHGENTKAIATLLRISPKTVETHRQHIMRKLGTNNIAALARYAIRHGLMTA